MPGLNSCYSGISLGESKLWQQKKTLRGQKPGIWAASGSFPTYKYLHSSRSFTLHQKAHMCLFVPVACNSTCSYCCVGKEMDHDHVMEPLLWCHGSSPVCGTTLKAVFGPNLWACTWLSQWSEERCWNSGGGWQGCWWPARCRRVLWNKDNEGMFVSLLDIHVN